MATPESLNRDESTVGYDEAVEMVRNVVSEWNFADHSDSANMQFAHQLAGWAYEAFVRPIRYSPAAEVPYEAVPESLRPLVSYHYLGRYYNQDENRVRLSSEPEFVYVEPYIPDWEELMEEYPYRELYAFIASNTDLLERIRIGKVLGIHKTVIDFEPRHSFEWGMLFCLKENPASDEPSISVEPYGSKGKTGPPLEYMRGYGDRGRVLSQTCVGLIIAMLDHFGREFRYPVSAATLGKLAAASSGSAVELPVDFNKAPGSGESSVMNLIISRLVDEGLIEGPKKE